MLVIALSIQEWLLLGVDVLNSLGLLEAVQALLVLVIVGAIFGVVLYIAGRK